MAEKRRILVITDSLGLPRDYPERCIYSDTWPALLKKDGHIIHQISIGGATVSELADQLLSYHLSFCPDVVLFQSGIVDCAPRAFTRNELFLLKSNPLGRLTLKALKSHTVRIRRFRKTTYTKPRAFGEVVKKILQRVSKEDIRLFWLGIIPSNSDYEKKVPGITANIDKFNSILFNELGEMFIDLREIPRHGIMSDHFHLNSYGHSFIYSKLRSLIGNA